LFLFLYEENCCNDVESIIGAGSYLVDREERASSGLCETGLGGSECSIRTMFVYPEMFHSWPV